MSSVITCLPSTTTFLKKNSLQLGNLSSDDRFSLLEVLLKAKIVCRSISESQYLSFEGKSGSIAFPFKDLVSGDFFFQMIEYSSAQDAASFLF